MDITKITKNTDATYDRLHKPAQEIAQRSSCYDRLPRDEDERDDILDVRLWDA
jgi:hypothetical protein